MRARNRDIADDRRIVHRIGVDVGDMVAVDGDDLLGDGVNVAARLEQLCPPGGIVLSRSARDAVRDRIALRLADLGEIDVKNISRPVRAFRVLAEGETQARVALGSGSRSARSLLLGGAVAATLAAIVFAVVIGVRPTPPSGPAAAATTPAIGSIVVLPFDCASEDGADGPLGDGLAQDVAAALSRFADLGVIGAETAAAYADDATRLRRIDEELGVRHVLKGASSAAPSACGSR